ncbi:HepT-like ribonuclease domain-containing protein [Anaerovirgula multivorans]
MGIFVYLPTKQSYIKEGKSKFMESTLIQDAVIRKLEIIGEATKKISIN